VATGRPRGATARPYLRSPALKLLGRYIAGQLMRPMLGILIVALFALLAERTLQIVDVVIGWRGSLLVIFEMLGYLVPHYIGFALPAALFIAILLTLGRLSRDGELDAMLASGAAFQTLLRPLFLVSLVLAALNFAVQSHLQPYSRYAYRAAIAALSNVSFQALLRERQFATLGATTYSVESIAPDRDSFGGLLLVTQQEDGGLLTVTAQRGRVLPATDEAPLRLELENGVQHFRPAEADGSGEGTPATTLRFRRFISDLEGENPEAFRPRGEDEREFTIPELWVSEGDPQRRIDPEEIAAELHVRLVRVAATVILPLVAVPLAIARRRTRRSYGFIIGVSLLLVFNQITQLGKTLADDGEISVWLGLWLPFAIFVAIGISLSLAKAMRVPGGTGTTRFEEALERLGDGIRRWLPRPGESAG
jgi:lipopolysaccharide export system permease protein